MKKILLLCLLAKLSFAQTNYYVSTSGSDGNAGTLAAPWRTIKKAFDTPLPNGSTVYIMAGTYTERLVASKSGSVSAPITFTNYQGQVVTVSGQNSSSVTPLLEVYSKSNLIIKGLRFMNTGGNFTCGIKVHGSSQNIKIFDNYIANINYASAITPYNCSTNPVVNSNPLIILGNTATAIQNIEIKGNTIENCHTGWSEALTVTGNVDNFLITENTVKNIGNIGIVVAGRYPWVFSPNNPAYNNARNGVISKNVVSNCKSPVCGKYSAGIYVDGANNITIERNRVSDSQVGIQVGCENAGFEVTGIKVRNNIIYGNERQGIGLGGIAQTGHGSVTESIVANNTLFLNNLVAGSDFGEIYITKVKNSIVKNNLIYAKEHYYAILMKVQYGSWYSNGNLFRNNLYFSSGSSSMAKFKWEENTSFFPSLLDMQSTYSQETQSVYSNPQFVNPTLSRPELHIKNTSGAIGVGHNTSTTTEVGNVDFDGNNRFSSRIDAGAYEYYNCPQNTFVFGDILGDITMKGAKILAENKVLGSNNKYQASSSIELKEGFQTNPNAVFTAEISTCY